MDDFDLRGYVCVCTVRASLVSSQHISETDGSRQESEEGTTKERQGSQKSGSQESQGREETEIRFEKINLKTNRVSAPPGGLSPLERGDKPRTVRHWFGQFLIRKPERHDAL